MKGVIIINHMEKVSLLSCENASKFLLHKGNRLFIDSVKSYGAALVDKNYDLTRDIISTTSIFHPHLVEVITLENE